MLDFKLFVFNPIKENTYILFDETGESAIIDAGNFDADENEKMEKFINDNNLTVKYILNTHCHWDHLFGCSAMQQKYDARFLCHDGDRQWLDKFSFICEHYGFGKRDVPQPACFYSDGDTVTFGNTKISVIHTPGHSQGGVSLYCAESGVLFSGDTLFFNSIGRTDLPGGNGQQLISSIKNKLMTLPDATNILPGHGLSTTVEYERQNNPYLQ